MEDIIFGTHNDHKVEEVASLLKGKYNIQSLHQLGLDDDIPEPYDSLTENARQKARIVHGWTNKNCFSEDTGLLVDSLGGEPGVRSARYAGENHDFQANINKLLHNLEGIQERQARFLTIICLIYKGKEYTFEGECRGNIAKERRGAGGFGYDSIFLPESSNRTFAEMSLKEKNEFSHRKKAVDKLIKFLQRQ